MGPVDAPRPTLNIAGFRCGQLLQLAVIFCWVQRKAFPNLLPGFKGSGRTGNIEGNGWNRRSNNGRRRAGSLQVLFWALLALLINCFHHLLHLNVTCFEQINLIWFDGGGKGWALVSTPPEVPSNFSRWRRWRIMHCMAPHHRTWLVSSFTCVADMPHRRRLTSASTEQLDVPTCCRSTIGGRPFPVAGAKVWNGLPSDVTSASSLSVCKNRLKTYLFCRSYETVWLWMTFPFPSHHLPSRAVVLAIGFYCLGH